MRMGDGGAAVIGGIVGGLIGGGAGYKAGYSKRDTELQPLITHLQQQLQAKDQQLSNVTSELQTTNQQLMQMGQELRTKNARIAELEKDRGIPILSDIRRKLGGSSS